jgi:hypothetical protein
MDVEISMVRLFSWELGSTVLISSLFMKIEGKRGKVCNALVTFVNLTVMNGYGSSNEISFVDLLLIPTLLSQNLKRVIPSRTGLLRLAHSSPFSRFLENLSKKGISVKSPIPGLSWKQTKVNSFPRTGWKPNLVQPRHN